MSLLSMIEQAIKSCKYEQAKINHNIQHYREILQTLTPQPKMGTDESESWSEFADDAAPDTVTSPVEKEEMELLERALEKALRVRTGTVSSKKDSNKQSACRKASSTSAVTSKEGMQASTAPKGNQKTARSTSKSASLDRKDHRKPGTLVFNSKSSHSYHPGQCKTRINRNIIMNCSVSSAGIVHHQAARASQQAVSASGSLARGQLHTSTLHSKNKTIRSNELSGTDLGTAAAFSTHSHNTVPVSHRLESGAHSLPPQKGKASDQTAKWKSLRRKQNRLWDKVVALQRKPVSGRSHFMERMTALFPKDWPCGCPDQTRILVARLTHQGHDLTQHRQAEEFLGKQTLGVATEQGSKANQYDSCLELERLLVVADHLQNSAHQAKEEWEAWDRWRPEGGCLCPTGANSVWGDGIIAPLPLTITYTSEAELRELENLRMRVALLQQETYIEQALLDTLSPQLSSIVPGPGCPDLSVLRGMYSLLGEGGERFPAIVLDSEPD
ncbi:uncharacterized protein LOC117548357 isoform X1 [Gymnodraco acuticeps]|uniref:Uncharacterized protein LOC117548357 isoform X1 n=1 Tax=Gymnodraco acuticeps TaxID=8218 RepID=A0A6P8UT32_GYMAC|nr:uncharacterized protein LOC117548357 isoform X1 [Gymnodraco acuticeps]